MLKRGRRSAQIMISLSKTMQSHLWLTRRVSRVRAERTTKKVKQYKHIITITVQSMRCWPQKIQIHSHFKGMQHSPWAGSLNNNETIDFMLHKIGVQLAKIIVSAPSTRTGSDFVNFFSIVLYTHKMPLISYFCMPVI